MKLKVLDLFSGIGGFSLGLERTGAFKTVAFCEIDDAAGKVLKKHWPEVPVYKDVKKLKGNESEYDVICGGFPCQDISIAGKKRGLKGERSGLWREFKRIIKEVKPRYAIIENVANMRSNGLQEVLKDLWQIGYASEWHIISARSVGAPHLRERIWIIAYPEDDRCDRGNSKEAKRKWDTSRYSEGKSQDTTRGGSSRLLESTNSDSERLQGLRSSERIQEEHTAINSSYDELTHSNNFRLWKTFASEEAQQEWWAKTASSVSHWQEAQSIVCGVDDGLSRGMDKYRRERIKQLGNSVVPQIPELIGRAIMEYEESI